jgi:hypothetical protein
MKQQNILILFTLLFANAISSSAQVFLTAPNGAVIREVRYVPSGRLNTLNSSTEVEIVGSPYLSDSYAQGSMFLTLGNFIGLEMRYNIYFDQVEFKNQDSVLALGPDDIIKKIVIGKQTFVVDKFEHKGKVFPTYYERLDSGKVSVMAKWLVLYKEMQRAKPMQGDVPPKYERLPTNYFVKIGQELPIKVKNVKQMIEALPSNREQVEKFAEEKKIRGGDRKDLVAIVDYYNSLP